MDIGLEASEPFLLWRKAALILKDKVMINICNFFVLTMLSETFTFPLALHK